MLNTLYQMGLFGYLTNGQTYSAPVLILLCVAAGVLCSIVGYLLGSINSAVIVSRALYRDDVRLHGSGNAGTTNMLRTYGKKAAALTLLGDVAKAVLAVLAGRFIGFPPVIGGAVGTVPIGGYIAGLCVVIGHAFPVFYGFRGGKGVLCGATVAAMLSPWVCLWLILLFAALVASTRYVSLASIIAAMAYPVLLDRIEGHSVATLFAMAIGFLIVYLHRSNIRRLLDRTENKLDFSGKKNKGKEHDIL